MPTDSLIPCQYDAIKKDLVKTLEEGFDSLMAAVGAGADPRAVELKVWEVLLPVGRQLLTDGFTLVALRATNDDLAVRGLERGDITLRTEADYWQTCNTSLGKVSYPLCAYRDRSGPAIVTRTPASSGPFAHHARCKSSSVLLEWECRLGSEFPFRRAEEALAFFSHDAAHVEDTTIARHLLRVGTLVERQWLYRPLQEFRELLSERATRDAKTDEPIVHASCDAHALRRYVDETWDAQWKMANGVRLWCIDRFTGATIHLGGEYTWGDCTEVGQIFAALIESGHLPAEGDYGHGLKTKLVFVSDGAEWFEKHILKQFPWAIAIVDAYHVMERLATYANERFGRGTPAAKRLYEGALEALFGPRDYVAGRSKPRQGGTRRRVRAPAPYQPLETSAGSEALLAFVNRLPVADEDVERHRLLIGFLAPRAAKLDYPRFKHLG
ncbi:MAG: hypothetical protein L6Q76_35975, partial [Polyangiaceae bacterium]|nr:hypothetical protein [Polyangiaceae bacterium]